MFTQPSIGTQRTSTPQHWQNVYQSKNATQVSWYTPHLETSLYYIQKYAAPHEPLFDIGCGASTLVDDLLALGYTDITLVDMAEAALQASQTRLEAAASTIHPIHWMVGDVTQMTFLAESCALWHDRAVFHFLTDEKAQARYIAAMQYALRPGGHVVMATFSPLGPRECSNLPTVQYDAPALQKKFGDAFTLCETQRHVHTTPFQTQQEFVYACFAKK